MAPILWVVSICIITADDFPPKLSNNYMSPDPLPTLHPPLPSLSEPTEEAQRSLLAETSVPVEGWTHCVHLHRCLPTPSQASL